MPDILCHLGLGRYVSQLEFILRFGEQGVYENVHFEIYCLAVAEKPKPNKLGFFA